MKKHEDFKKLCQPVVDYIRKNYHPHAKVIITPTSAELLEGEMASLYYEDDENIKNSK